MRIAIDASSTQGKARGMGVYTSNLLQALAKLRLRHSITVILDSSIPPPEDLASLPFESMGIEGFGGAAFWEQVHLPARMRSFDLLHSPANGSPLFCPCPRVVTVHDAIFMRRLKDISSRTYLRQIQGHFYRRFLYPASIRKALGIITVSETSRKDISAKLRISSDRLTVIPEALPVAFARAIGEPVEALKNEVGLRMPYFLALGAYEKRKNLNLLFEALALAKKREGEGAISLVLAGAENMGASGYAQAVKALGIEERVLFLPYVSCSRLKALYENAEAFLWPTRKEGFGLPLLQAMSCKTPIIAADTECNRETAGEAATFLDPDDAKGWASAMGMLRTNRILRSGLIEKGKDRLGYFSWESAAEATIQVYERALKVR